jgi:hypothetical protein
LVANTTILRGKTPGLASILQFEDSSNANYVALKAPDTLTSSTTWTLPSADGAVNQVLKTDGAGNLGWVSVSTGGGGGAALSSFTSAIASNSFDNLNYGQNWSWSTLNGTDNKGLTLTNSSNLNETNTSLFNLDYTGTNARGSLLKLTSTTSPSGLTNEPLLDIKNTGSIRALGGAIFTGASGVTPPCTVSSTTASFQTEVTFANGSGCIASDYVKVGDVVHINGDNYYVEIVSNFGGNFYVDKSITTPFTGATMRVSQSGLTATSTLDPLGSANRYQPSLFTLMQQPDSVVFKTLRNANSLSSLSSHFVNYDFSGVGTETVKGNGVLINTNDASFGTLLTVKNSSATSASASPMINITNNGSNTGLFFQASAIAAPVGKGMVDFNFAIGSGSAFRIQNASSGGVALELKGGNSGTYSGAGFLTLDVATSNGVSQLITSNAQTSGNLLKLVSSNPGTTRTAALLNLTGTNGTTTTNPYVTLTQATFNCNYFFNTTDFSCSSDERLKNSITDSTPILDDLLDLKIRSFKYNGTEETIGYGVIAQEVLQTNFADRVYTDSNNNYGVKTVSNWELLKGMQELNKKVDDIAAGRTPLSAGEIWSNEQIAVITDITKRIEAIEAKNTAQDAKIKALETENTLLKQEQQSQKTRLDALEKSLQEILSK